MTNNTTMTALEVIRIEGSSGDTAHKIGFNYAMSVLGTFKDYKKNYLVIRRIWRGGGNVSFWEMKHYHHASGIGYSEAETKKIFMRRSEREYCKANGSTPPTGYMEEKWKAFKRGDEKLRMPKFAGGPVTYHQLLDEGKTDEEIEPLFNQLRRKHSERDHEGLGHATCQEFQKLLAKWDYSKYLDGEASNGFGSQLERFCRGRQMEERTSFCTLVSRMMLLVQAKHCQKLTNTRWWQRDRLRQQKKIANDKHCAKYNMMKSKMGTSSFNAMKARDQAAKDKKKAAEVRQNASQVSKFVQWRTQTTAGLAFDKAPVVEYVQMFPSSTRFERCRQKVQLGYGTREILAAVVKDCLRNRDTKGLSDMYISFKPDPTRAETQVYQYAAIQGCGALKLRKTKDVDCSRTFKITGVFMGSSNMWVNLNSMTSPVYYSLPLQWRDFEEWSGFGVKGNPKCSTVMKTLFKIVDSNIESFRFVKDDTEYSIGYTTNARMQKSVAELLGGVKSKYDTAAAAAARVAEEVKCRRAQAARAAGCNNFPKNDKSIKVMLVRQLAEGKIDMEAFKMGMSALD
jgi:hypothetical protein